MAGGGAAVGWTDADSRDFLARADIVTPSRTQVLDLIAALLPAGGQVLELCCGGGDLGARVLTADRSRTYLGLDGSQVMLDAARRRLAPFGDRARVREFRLEAGGWRTEVGTVQAVVTMLAVHHLDAPGKRRLFADMLPLLEPGGALLIFDLVLPSAPPARAAIAQAWDGVVARQGGADALRAFTEARGNIYRFPDPMDMPDPLADQLVWLRAAGYADADCFWQRAGHALYGGYAAP